MQNKNEADGWEYGPELNEVDIKKGKLYLNYGGRAKFGSWCYTFRYQNSEFELIGYDYYQEYQWRSRGSGEVWDISINFLTKKVKVATNLCIDEDCNDYKKKEKWSNTNDVLTIKEPITLQKLVDIDDISLCKLLPDVCR